MSDKRTTVRLYEGVPLSISNNDTRYFSNRSEQSAFFKSKQKLEKTLLSYVRLDVGTVDVEVNINSVYNINYISFINASHENKEYYGFVTNVEYISEKNTRIHFELDMFQTYMFDFKVSGTVEREHCDYTELNTIPEEIDEGDLVVKSIEEMKHLPEGVKIAVIGTTIDLTDPNGFNGGTNGAINQPYNYYIVGGSDKEYTINGSSMTSFKKFITDLAKEETTANKIAFIYITNYPLFNLKVKSQTASLVQLESDLIDHVRPKIGEVVGEGIGRVNFVGTSPELFTFNNVKPYTGDYAKLNYYPYAKYKLFTPSGTQEFKPELLPNKIEIHREALADHSPNAVVKVFNYAGERTWQNKSSYPISANLPVVTEDIAVLMQHQMGFDKDNMVRAAGMATIGMLITGGTIAPAIGAGIGSGVASGVGDYFSRTQAIKKSKRSPNHESGSLGRMIDIASNIYPLWIRYGVTPEYEQILKRHFHKYGWKVMRHKIPNIKTRENFNFVKMVDVTVTGRIPQDAMTDIRNKLMEGVTFWHTDDVGNYSVTNNKI